MTQFSIGDRVVYKHTFDGSAAHNGKTGVIKQVFDNNSYVDPYALVQWDTISTAPSHPFLHNLVLDPSPSTADTLRAQADALSAEATAERIAANQARADAHAAADAKTRLAAQYRNVAADLEARG